MRLALAAAFVALVVQAPPVDRHVVVISIDGLAAYALADPAIPLPTLRALARDGVMAEAMIPVNPTVTWPNHTTLVTGVPPERHGLLYNGLPVRAAAGSTDAPVRIEAHVDKPQLVQAPTVYDAAHAAGLTTAEIDWVAIENAPTITWAFSEYSKPQAPLAREMVAAGAITDLDLDLFARAPITFRDEIWTRAAEFLIAHHRPNLLLLHLLTTDSMQHQAGARSLGAQTAIALADARVARVVDAARQAGLLAQTTFVIVSDHGFKTFKQRVRANVVLKEKGLGSRAWAIAEGGTAMIYVTDSVDKAATITAVKAAFEGTAGVGTVLTPSEFAAAGFPSPDVQPRMAEVVVAAREGVAFVDGIDGPAIETVPAGANIGAHGYLNTDPDMRAVFIASGAGVRKGATLGVISNLDVAPTLAAWLGVSLPSATGRPLSAAIAR
ncbi:MAG TPA: ectonucleotide pyrophosphatase/phosphodiesterase [Vicinamibacterales bacterium]|jgi:predicted AlkP superfamily pyrophosphatase or phosphodiesterase